LAGFGKPPINIPTRPQAYVPTITGRKYDKGQGQAALDRSVVLPVLRAKLSLKIQSTRISSALQPYLSKAGIRQNWSFGTGCLPIIRTVPGINADLFGDFAESNFNRASASVSPPPHYFSTKNPDGWTDLMTRPQSPEADPKIMQKLVQVLYEDVTVINIAYQTDMWVIKITCKNPASAHAGAPSIGIRTMPGGASRKIKVKSQN
jgi:hypothetical protein